MTITTKLSDLTGDYALDPARTRIGFATRGMGVKVRGQFDRFEGGVHLDGDDPTRSSVQVTIAAASVQTDDRRRDAHLRDRFLDVGSYPAITFTSTRVEQAGETSFRVTGDLVIRGVTKPVTLEVELTSADLGDVVLTGSARINRKDWGVGWAASLGTVGRQVGLEFNVAAIRQR